MNPKEINELYNAIKPLSDCHILHYEEMENKDQLKDFFDAVIISGSEARIVNENHRKRFGAIMDLIRNLDIPTFAICFGHQLLCWTFGAGVSSLCKPVKDQFERIRIIEFDEIFDGFENRHIVLAEWHNDYVIKEGLNDSGFILLADSESCEVEAVKHIRKPFYGVQFHPERIRIKNEVHGEGHLLIKNFYDKVVRK
ncbi:MAG: gamma-glutamyl-gamma-aminobutyrate hydrolase family protein [Methanomassiliicoccales archaeon]|jgi:GMP synthase (glutamine-hydrolysing)|nr:gamma-glutamyl-gamma-aminobutyrate hydrolase family protein [Methanomassiliicoccales archaeon]